MKYRDCDISDIVSAGGENERVKFERERERVSGNGVTGALSLCSPFENKGMKLALRQDKGFFVVLSFAVRVNHFTFNLPPFKSITTPAGNNANNARIPVLK